MAKADIWDHHSSSAEPERRGNHRSADRPRVHDRGNDEGERAKRIADISRDMPKGEGRYDGDSKRY